MHISKETTYQNSHSTHNTFYPFLLNISTSTKTSSDPPSEGDAQLPYPFIYKPIIYSIYQKKISRSDPPPKGDALGEGKKIREGKRGDLTSFAGVGSGRVVPAAKSGVVER